MSRQHVLDTYNTTDQTELEIRFNVNDKIAYQKLIASIKGQASVEQSINFILPSSDGNRICQVSFVDGEKQNIGFIKKNRLQRSFSKDGMMLYKTVVSSEIPIPKFSINLSEFARIKLRLSVRPKEIKGWRVDFTLVKTINKINETFKKYKENILKQGITVENFVKTAPWGYIDSLELEVEHIGDEKKIQEHDINTVVQYIFNLAGNEYKNRFEYQQMIYEIAQYVVSAKERENFKHKKGLRDLYNRVWELNRKEYYDKVFPNIKDFYVLGKADGVRSIIVIRNNFMYILNGGLKILQLQTDYGKDTICDAEHILDTDTYYVFDVLAHKGEKLTNLPTETRISYIDAVVKMSEGKIKRKTIVSLTDNYISEIKNIWADEQSNGLYEVDGLIFTPKNKTYSKMRSWKWKPLSHMSIDFLVKKSPPSLNGIHPYIVKDNHTLMFLFSGINKTLYDKLKLMPLPKYKELFPSVKMYNYFPIQFSPSNDPYAYMYWHPNDSEFSVDDIANNVCEFKRVKTESDDGQSYKWEIMRIRTDRKTELIRGNYFGNSFYIAEYTWQNYENPLVFDDLIITSSEYMNRGYFQEEKTEMYRSVTAYNSYVKGLLIKQFNEVDWLVDLAAGKGQDMFRVSDAKIKNALYLDIDSQALSELVSRKHDFERGISKLNTRIYTKLIDLKTPYDEILKQLKNISIPVGEINVVMCNFAIHYLMGTPNNLRNVIKLISALLKPGGSFFFTSFNGSDVFNLLKENDEWNVREGEVLKYSIKKKYTSKKLMPTGQAIDVLLPFSRGKYYEEFLVNYDYVIDTFESNGFSLTSEGSFDEFTDNFSKNVKKYSKQLTSDDKKFLSLYSYAVFQKSVKGGIGIKKHIRTIANKYKYADGFVNTFVNCTSYAPVETVYDIKCSLPYYPGSEIIKPSVHIGQRKLFLSEMQFLTKHPNKICVYAGSSPSNKTHYLSTLFPDVKFILIDPNKFNIILPNGKSHRKERHDDIIHIYHHFGTSSNTYDVFDNKKLSELDEKQQDEILDFIKTSDHKIYIIEDYMGVDDAKLFKKLGDITFISDIRSNSSKDGFPLDSDIYWNMSMMFNWISIMLPVESMLKHRMPYGDDTDSLSDVYKDDFELSKKFGIDFENDYKQSISKMSKATLYIQAWAGISSAEIRMHVKRENISNIVEYNVKEIEERFFYYNCINRPWYYHENENSDKSLGFCHCGDCSLENKIITDYVKIVNPKENVKNIVEYLGKITNRYLYNVHKFNIWEDTLNRPRYFEKIVKRGKRMYLKSRKLTEQKQKHTYKKHRGDKGKA